MPADPESRAAVAVENDYDSFAEAYTVENDTSLINAYYTRPAIVDLAGDVAGRRVLDAGCGSGAVSEALRERGAVVAGFDRSAKMVELARRRLGADTDLRVADIGEPLPYLDGAFDDVVAALVLHYLQDWTAPLAELRRVLKPGGRLIVVVNHPIMYKMQYREADYFATSKWSDEYTFNGQHAVLTYWHRPLHAMTDAFTAAGFRTAVISEPPPAPEAHRLFPDEMARFPSGAFLSFLFFVLETA
ncbi:methyltransferase domain-containing protein [Actinokineospora sp. NBRC 105648]|uniref:class I SAM-dependent methyltransferase n=1 Tax=Actinokineospora sp. NBRC 105648 TaxID=3032206 RepID=UPI00249FFC77|nr:methyltransferase domain-containing protein [Actinokineospora sp. NBRC 105648]GLZ38846.1 methyltransferase [Actinokineospora sp. NBRC 105648]